MAKKVTFNISGNANDASNKWAIIGLTDKLCNPKLFRFVRSKVPVSSHSFSTEWQVRQFNPIPTSYSNAQADHIVCTITQSDSANTTTNYILYGRIRDNGSDADRSAADFNPTIEFDAGPECDFDIQHIPGRLGDFRVILKNIAAMTYPNTIAYGGKVIFTDPDTDNKFYAYFKVTFEAYVVDHSQMSVRFITPWDSSYGQIDSCAVLWLCGPGTCDFSTESMESIIRSGMRGYEMYVDSDLAEYVVDLPQSTKMIGGNSSIGFYPDLELWESDFIMAVNLPNGQWKFGTTTTGVAVDGEIFHI